MNLNKSLIVLLASMLISISLYAEEIEGGSIAVIDVEVAIFGTEASKQAFEELSSSKEWKEVEEDLKLKKWTREDPEYEITVDNILFEKLNKEQYNFLYNIKANEG